MIASISD